MVILDFFCFYERLHFRSREPVSFGGRKFMADVRGKCKNNNINMDIVAGRCDGDCPHMVILICSITNVFASNQTLHTKPNNKKKIQRFCRYIRLLEWSSDFNRSGRTLHIYRVDFVVCRRRYMQFVPQNDFIYYFYAK